uniref:ARID domain-containing protein n=1 Tax=Parastrongyloides trichosuri TaxID=131310 RepID=A0A0N4Z7A7_PARTI
MYSTNSFPNFSHLSGANLNLLQNPSQQLQALASANQSQNQNIHTTVGSHQIQQPNTIQTGFANIQNSLGLNGNGIQNVNQNSNIANYSLGWPLFNPLINVPYFDLETYGSVNLDASCSQQKSGVDLPLHDITTLRFFYNFGVHQAKDILLKQQAMRTNTPTNAQILALMQQAHQQGNVNNSQNDNNGSNLLQKQQTLNTGISPSVMNNQNNCLPNNVNSFNILQNLQQQQQQQHGNGSSLPTPSLASIFAQQSKPVQNTVPNQMPTTPFRINPPINSQQQQESNSNNVNYDNLLVQNLFSSNCNSNNLLQHQPAMNNPTAGHSNMNSLSIALQAAKNGHHAAQHYIQELMKMRNETSIPHPIPNSNEHIDPSQQIRNGTSPNSGKLRNNNLVISASPKGPIPIDPAPPVCQNPSVISKPIPSTSSGPSILHGNQYLNQQITGIDNKQLSQSDVLQNMSKMFSQGKNIFQFNNKDSVNFNNMIDQLPAGVKKRCEESLKVTLKEEKNSCPPILNSELPNNPKLMEEQYMDYNNILKNEDKLKTSKELLLKVTGGPVEQKKNTPIPPKLLTYDKTSLEINNGKVKKNLDNGEDCKSLNTTAITPATALLAATEMHYTQTFSKNKNDHNESDPLSTPSIVPSNEIMKGGMLTDGNKLKKDYSQEISVTGSQQNSNTTSPKNNQTSLPIVTNSTAINSFTNSLSESPLKSIGSNNQKEQQFVEQPPLAPSLMINFLSCYFSQCKNQLQSNGTSLHLDDHGNPIDYSSRPIDPIFRNAKKDSSNGGMEALQSGSVCTIPEIEAPIKETDLITEAQQSVLIKNTHGINDTNNRNKIIDLSCNNTISVAGEKRPHPVGDRENPDEKKIKLIKNEDK